MHPILTGTIRYWLPVTLGLGLLSPIAVAAAPIPADLRPLHALKRLSFGPRPGDIEQVKAIGVERYIREQLQPESLSEPAALTARLDGLETLRLKPGELFQEYGPLRQAAAGQSPPPIQRLPDGTMPVQAARPGLNAGQANRMRSAQVVQQAVQARLLRSTQSPRQLQEVLTDFWFNHFNVFAQKGLTRLWVGNYELTAIRPQVLGRFRDLLGATAHHPAMLFYLDNWQNTGPNTRGARGRFKGLNENYARELLELHTLGVDGGYSQQDVTEVARVFTGWGFCRPGRADSDSGFCFDARRHDTGDKVVLGQVIRGGGVEEGEQVLDLLARHPATARRVSYQLAQYFVADEPPPALVERLAKRFTASEGDLRSVMSSLFESSEFWDTRYYDAKFKTPYRYVLSAARATGVGESNPLILAGALRQLAMPLYGCPTPDGYKNTRATWLTPDAMARRLSFATTMASGQLVSRLSDPVRQPRLATPVEPLQLQQTLGDRFSTKTRNAFQTSPSNLRAALILGSPEMMSY